MAGKAYEFVMELFNFNDLDSTIQREMQKSSLSGGMMNTAAGIIIAILTMLVFTFLMVLYLGYVYDSLPASSMIHSVRPSINSSLLISSIIFFGLINLPFLFIWVMIHQGSVYLLSRLFRGAGSFSSQYFITSFIPLALGTGLLGIVPVFLLSIFIPCFNLFFILLFLVASAYLAVFVQAKMLVAVHRITLPTALVITTLTSIAFVFAFVVLQILMVQMGLGPDIGSSFGALPPPMIDLGNVTTVQLVNNSSIIH